MPASKFNMVKAHRMHEEYIKRNRAASSIAKKYGMTLPTMKKHMASYLYRKRRGKTALTKVKATAKERLRQKKMRTKKVQYARKVRMLKRIRNPKKR